MSRFGSLSRDVGTYAGCETAQNEEQLTSTRVYVFAAVFNMGVHILIYSHVRHAEQPRCAAWVIPRPQRLRSCFHQAISILV